MIKYMHCMKKKKLWLIILFLFLLFLTVGLVLYYFSLKKPDQRTLDITPKIKQEETIQNEKKEDNIEKEIVSKTSLFIPYWMIGDGVLSTDNYDRLLYFGIRVNNNEIDRNDPGYQKLNVFSLNTKPSQEKYLTLRMTDNEANVLKEKDVLQKIIADSVDIACEYGFDGIALDLEISVILTENMQTNINGFVKDLYLSSKENNLKFAYIIYGDAFYRNRGYDVKSIGENSDEIMIMAYDFHKSIGNPGPNFPLDYNKEYGYSFKSMINDFLQIIPKEKISIVFGMYGYDWQVNEEKISAKQAKALTLNEIKADFLNTCKWEECIVKRDITSSETEINYVEQAEYEGESVLKYHIIWFEDEESVSKKQEFLKEKGIGSISYWAYGYF